MRQAVRAAWRTIRRPRVLDTALVVVLVGFGLISTVAGALSGAATDILVSAALMSVSSVFLLFRRSRPIAVMAAVLTADLLNIFLVQAGFSSIPTTIALYSVGRYTRSGRAWALASVACLVNGIAVYLAKPGNQIGIGLAALLAIGVGQYFRLRHELRERREQHAAETAVREERRRIARELHDVVAHHISVINVLVGAGRTTMATDPAQAQDVLVTAERTAREAMTEMRQLLHVLRAEDDNATEDSSGVGAATLPALIAKAAGGGLPASLDVRGDVVPLPSAVDHAVYRIVQEALTNSRKHAGGARASVLVAYHREAVEVEVLDDGVGHKSTGSGGGFGLGGMAERVALCGGQLQTGPRPEGGFRVHARIPLPVLRKEDQ
ncbi:histidine kinase [Streptosporangium soli]|nr:histidine kinase [Streptosporangium sp. KLBMP 9127]